MKTKNYDKRKEPCLKQLYNARFRVREMGFEIDNDNKIIRRDWNCDIISHPSIQMLTEFHGYIFLNN